MVDGAIWYNLSAMSSRRFSVWDFLYVCFSIVKTIVTVLMIVLVVFISEVFRNIIIQQKLKKSLIDML